MTIRHMSTTPQRAKPREIEDTELEIVIRWVRTWQRLYPGLEFLHHIPNGGKRNKIVAIKLKRRGVLPGVCDLFLPHARGGYFGLYIEMKAPKNYHSTITGSQRAFMSGVKQQNYSVVLCYGAEEAKRAIMSYYQQEPTRCI